MYQDEYNWISRRAHEIWQSEGCPNGRDREQWSQAVVDWQARDDAAPPPHEPDAVAPPIRRVLVVDDEPLIRFSTVDALEVAGFEVLEAGNADEAPILFEGTQIDAVFTDVNMPGSTDGLGLMNRVRARSPGTRVIVTSGHVRLAAFDLASGVSFLPKPENHSAIVDMLKASFDPSPGRV
ncbi:response regulator [Agrobacterium tumefaciens]|jgi:CheY-like chemotaxis protein|uniref:Response regulator n=1 Tax=Agrobacterium tumefaciens TaxID=358 RepID=A0AA44J608_AGRTU|nr:response regulator [Agrobacterium tumefaciens]NSL23103.1 response regulator [Agrobacterium tumefaciens]NTB89690.1 response regulator [Agrobacterium tumefaciens]NTC15520.1 response regulator [Agrobacterium tumefaciens]NTC26604.1 response regulator [Agrobacterium tumefaciens]NTC58114.1 response regulator [Agrobacterium tumefaciens]